MRSLDQSVGLADLLRSCPLFAAMDAEQLARLAEIASLRHFRPGQWILRQGQPPPGIFVVATGQVRIFKLWPDGRQHILQMIGPGQSFAEVAVLGQFELPANAQAVRRSCCAFIPAGGLMQMLRRDALMATRLLAGMSLWVRRLVELLEDVVLRDATSRVAHYLVGLAGSAGGRARTVRLPMLKRDLANHLGLTGETLSRCLRRLRQMQIITMPAPSTLHIRNLPALREVAGGSTSEKQLLDPGGS